MEHSQIMPAEGRVEHDPMEIWSNTCKCIQGALDKAGLTSADIASVGITNQRETTVAWDRTTGKPLYNAVVWMDMRSSHICEEVATRLGGKDALRDLTGIPIVPYFAGTKIRWLIENVPEVKSAYESNNAMFGTIDSWLMYLLSGKKQHLTDVTNASRTLLMNIHTLAWDAKLLEIFNIDEMSLPEIRASSESYFAIEEPACLAGVPVAGVLGDQQAALFGQACFSPGEGKNTYGTGCFLLLNTGETPVQSTHGMLTTVGYQIAGQPAVYALEGSVAIGGAVVQWLRDNLGIIKEAPDVETLALSVPDNGGVYFVPAFSGLYAPYWKDDARGVIVGMSRYSNKGHISRAALEAVAYQSSELFNAMEKDSKVKLTALKVDGGMVVNETLMQFQADILNTPVVRPKVCETTALGAAYAAGLAVGFWKDIDSLKKNWSADKTWSPSMDEKTRGKLFHGWKKAIDRSYGWIDEI